MEKSQSPSQQITTSSGVPLQISQEQLQQLQQFQQQFTAIQVKQEFPNQNQLNNSNDLKHQIENQGHGQIQQMHVIEGSPVSPHHAPISSSMGNNTTTISTMSPLQAISANPNDWGNHNRLQLLQPSLSNQNVYQHLYPPVIMSNLIHSGIGQQPIQVITTGKSFPNGAPQMIATANPQNKSMLSGNGGFSGSYTIPGIPSSQSQALVFSPVNVISSQQPQQQQTILSSMTNQNTNMKNQQDLQKSIQNQQKALQQKVNANNGMGNAGNMGNNSNNNANMHSAGQQCVQVSQATMPQTAQLINPLQQTGAQTMQITAPWGVPQFWGNGIQPQTLLAQNPIIIRGTQPDGTHGMFIQQATAHHAIQQNPINQQTITMQCNVPQLSTKPRGQIELNKPRAPLILPQNISQVRPASSVSTQTAQNQNIITKTIKRGTKQQTVRPALSNKVDNSGQIKSTVQQLQQLSSMQQIVTSAGNKMVVVSSGQPINIPTSTANQQSIMSNDKQGYQLQHIKQQQPNSLSNLQQQFIMQQTPNQQMIQQQITQQINLQQLNNQSQNQQQSGQNQQQPLLLQLQQQSLAQQSHQNLQQNQLQAAGIQNAFISTNQTQSSQMGQQQQQQQRDQQSSIIHQIVLQQQSPQMSNVSTIPTSSSLIVTSKGTGNMSNMLNDNKNNSNNNNINTNNNNNNNNNINANINNNNNCTINNIQNTNAMKVSSVQSSQISTNLNINDQLQQQLINQTSTTPTSYSINISTTNPILAMTNLTTAALSTTPTSTDALPPTITSTGSKLSESIDSKNNNLKITNEIDEINQKEDDKNSENKLIEKQEDFESKIEGHEIKAEELLKTAEKHVTESTKNNIVDESILKPPIKASPKIEKELPKAMIKPNILTHVIEGFVIQEGSEPFCTTRTRYSDKDSQDEPQNKKSKIDDSDSLDDIGKCESCGKLISKSIKSTFAKKGFCSPACTKDGGENEFSDVSCTTQNTNKISEILNISETENAQAPDECPLAQWTVSDVCEFIKNLPGCSDYADDFAMQEIDGQALLLLKENHLVNAMQMKLGPALKIVAKVEAMKEGNAEKESKESQ